MEPDSVQRPGLGAETSTHLTVPIFKQPRRDANDYQTFESACKVMRIKGLDSGLRECSECHREKSRQKVVFEWLLEDVKS